MLVVAAKCSPVLPYSKLFFPESGSDCIAVYLFVLVHNFINFHFYLCVWVCVCILLKSEEEVRSLGGGMSHPTWTLGTEPPSCRKAASSLNC